MPTRTIWSPSGPSDSSRAFPALTRQKERVWRPMRQDVLKILSSHSGTIGGWSSKTGTFWCKMAPAGASGSPLLHSDFQYIRFSKSSPATNSSISGDTAAQVSGCRKVQSAVLGLLRNHWNSGQAPLASIPERLAAERRSWLRRYIPKYLYSLWRIWKGLLLSEAHGENRAAFRGSSRKTSGWLQSLSEKRPG